MSGKKILNSHPIKIHLTENPCGAPTNQAVEMKNGVKKMLIDPAPYSIVPFHSTCIHSYIHLQKAHYPGHGHGEWNTGAQGIYLF